MINAQYQIYVYCQLRITLCLMKSWCDLREDGDNAETCRS